MSLSALLFSAVLLYAFFRSICFVWPSYSSEVWEPFEFDFTRREPPRCDYHPAEMDYPMVRCGHSRPRGLNCAIKATGADDDSCVIKGSSNDNGEPRHMDDILLEMLNIESIADSMREEDE